jgi:hypothetical protein
VSDGFGEGVLVVVGGGGGAVVGTSVVALGVAVAGGASVRVALGAAVVKVGEGAAVVRMGVLDGSGGFPCVEVGVCVAVMAVRRGVADGPVGVGVTLMVRAGVWLRVRVGVCKVLVPINTWVGFVWQGATPANPWL